MKPEFTIADVNGKKTLVVNGKSLMTKQQVTDQIAALEERVSKRLPATKAKLKAAELKARAEANIDRQIDQATEIKDALEALVAELD
jgi:hypothetical protein